PIAQVAVSPANVDLANSDALKIAREADPQGIAAVTSRCTSLLHCFPPSPPPPPSARRRAHYRSDHQNRSHGQRSPLPPLFHPRLGLTRFRPTVGTDALDILTGKVISLQVSSECSLPRVTCTTRIISCGLLGCE